MEYKKITLGIYLLLWCQFSVLHCSSRKNYLKNLHMEVKDVLALQDSLKDNLQLLQGDLEKLKCDLTSIVDLVQSQIPLDCSGVKLKGNWATVAQIKPPGLPLRQVRCDQFTDGGGWTVVVHRNAKKYRESKLPSNNRKPRSSYYSKRCNQEYKGYDYDSNPLNFNKTWVEFKKGFGDPQEEYWIGNEVLHSLTKERPWEAAIVLEDWKGTVGRAFWNSFRVLGEDQKFRLQVSGYDAKRSDVGEGFVHHDNRSFSTIDADNDDHHEINCAEKYGGGWWFNKCHIVHLTGTHLSEGEGGEHSVHYRSWSDSTESLRVATLMIRPSKP